MVSSQIQTASFRKKAKTQDDPFSESEREFGIQNDARGNIHGSPKGPHFFHCGYAIPLSPPRRRAQAQLGLCCRFFKTLFQLSLLVHPNAAA